MLHTYIYMHTRSNHPRPVYLYARVYVIVKVWNDVSSLTASVPLVSHALHPPPSPLLVQARRPSSSSSSSSSSSRLILVFRAKPSTPTPSPSIGETDLSSPVNGARVSHFSHFFSLFENFFFFFEIFRKEFFARARRGICFLSMFPFRFENV